MNALDRGTCKAARMLIDWTAAQLAEAAAVSQDTLRSFESGRTRTLSRENEAAIRKALEAQGVQFLESGQVASGPGVALGAGMLSKYTIALLGPAALLFCLLDARARAWFLRPQPYAAVLLAALLFAPVVWWNYTHDWASFRFQGGERFVEPARFQLHVMLQNILLVATPLPLLVLPLLWVRRWAAEPAAEPDHAEARNRLFVACVTGVPLAVFAWSALKHEPRLNWTGPIWLATLPMLGWAIVHARTLARPWLGAALRRAAGPIVGLLLALLVFVQIRASRFNPWLYWATIIASTTAGTTMADFVTRRTAQAA